MFYNRTLNNIINKTHERAPRIAYPDNILNFTELLQKDNAVTVQEKNLEVLATEVYKIKIGITQRLIKKIFLVSTHAYNLRSTCKFKLENGKTVHYSPESLSFLGPKICKLVPLEIKFSHSLEEFKRKTKS